MKYFLNEYKTIAVYFITSLPFYFLNSYLNLQVAYHMAIFRSHILVFNILFATLEKAHTQNMIYQTSVCSSLG